MRARWMLPVLLIFLLGGVSGCVDLWNTNPQPEGLLRITIQQDAAMPHSVRPKVIPGLATKIRIRIWHPQTGFNHVATLDLSVPDQQLTLALAEDEGYVVDAISYFVRDDRALALTGGREPSVSVSAKETTNVQLSLRPWTTETYGDESVGPEKPYVVEVVATDAGGLITRQTFASATLHASLTSFEDPATDFPAVPRELGIVEDDSIRLTATSPDVDNISILYAAALVEFATTWTDASLVDPDERTICLELPNRYMGEGLHTLTIDPTTGGITIGISGAQ